MFSTMELSRNEVWPVTRMYSSMAAALQMFSSEIQRIAFVHAGGARRDGQHDGDNHQRDLQRQALLQAEQHGEANVQQYHADPHGGGHAEDGAHQGDDVDRVADAAADALAQQRIQGRPDGQRHAPAVGEVAHGHAEERIHGPAGHAVVEHGPDHGVLGCAGRLALARRRYHVLGDGSGHGVEEHVDAHTGGEQHGHPGEEPVLRTGVVRAEPDRAFLGKGHPQHEPDHHGDGEDVEPAEVLRDPGHHGLHGGLRAARARASPRRRRR